MPAKYAHINFTPPQSVRDAAKRGLELRRKYGRGGLSNKEAAEQGIGSGVQRATNLANGDRVSPETIGRMVSFFARHEKNKDGKTESGEPGAGAIAWLLWGGTPGQSWSNKIKRQMEAADMENKSLAELASQIMAVRSLANGHSLADSRPLPLTYKSEVHTGAMVALFLPTSIGARFILPDSNALPPSELHVTLAYLGEAALLSDWQKIEHAHEVVKLIAENYPPLQGNINGCGRFCNEDDEGDPFFIIPDLPKLPTLRQMVVDFLDSRCEIEPASDHGFSPHITLTYIPHSSPNPFDQIELTPVTFPTISLVLGNERYDYPFTMGLSNISKAALIERMGARHTGGERELIQKMHDMALSLGAECHPLERKAGAKHSFADQVMIQRIHDNCAELGAVCQAMPQRDDLYHSQIMKEGEIIKAQNDAPNYEPASTPQRCEICKFIQGDPGEEYCTRFEFAADPDYVCDDWVTFIPDEIPGYEAKSDLAWLTENILVLRGGPTSGNWAHTGRPGKKGGSGSGGGHRRIGVKPGATRKDIKQASRQTRVKDEGKKSPSRADDAPRDTVTKRLREAARDVGVIRQDGASIRLSTSYNPDFVNELKSKVSGKDRRWDGSKKEWVVSASERDTANEIMSKYFNTIDFDKVGKKGVLAAEKRAKTAKIRGTQLLLRENEDRLIKERDGYQQTVDDYPYNSRRGINARRGRDLMDYALADAKKPIGAIKEAIQIRGMNAALREIGVKNTFD